MTIYEFIGAVAFLYSVVNPVGVIPIFLNLSHTLERGAVSRIIYIASFSGALILVGSALAGDYILRFFNVSLDDFRIAGGMLVIYIAFNMFRAHYGDLIQTTEERTEAEKDVSEIAITPLAFPLLIGPAEISIMITYAGDMNTWLELSLLILAALLTSILIGITLSLAVPVNRILGKTGINVATRFMALIVASIGVSFIMTGLKNNLTGIAI